MLFSTAGVVVSYLDLRFCIGSEPADLAAAYAPAALSQFP